MNTLIPISPENRTVAMGGDVNYAWGVFLLLSSMRRWGMREQVLIGTYSWPAQWVDFLKSWPNVKIVPLANNAERCAAVTKPVLMMQAETDYVTWVDADGIFLGNCSDYLYGEPDALYARSYLPTELATHTFARMPHTISTWLSDVNSLETRRDIADICTNVVGVSLKNNRHLMEKWITQMDQVLPHNVGIVAAKNTPYFQTDESVLNSLLSCWKDAPEITRCYRLNNPQTAYYAHFAYNPKPWQALWTPFALRYYDQILSLVEWCAENSMLPDFAKLPRTLQRQYETWYRIISPLASNYYRYRKLRRKLGW